jgi:hypothetical protein
LVFDERQIADDDPDQQQPELPRQGAEAEQRPERAQGNDHGNRERRQDRGTELLAGPAAPERGATRNLL